MSEKKNNYDLHLRTLKQRIAAEHIDSLDNKSQAILQVINSERKKQTKVDRPSNHKH